MRHSTRRSDLNLIQTSDCALPRSKMCGIAVQPEDGLLPLQPESTPHSTALPAPLQPVGCKGPLHRIVVEHIRLHSELSPRPVLAFASSDPVQYLLRGEPAATPRLP